MHSRTLVLLATVALLAGSAAAFPRNLPTSFTINATVQAMFQYSDFGYYRMASGFAMQNVVGFIQSPSREPGTLVSIGLSVPGEFLAGWRQDWAGASLAVDNVQGVLHVNNFSAKGSAWDKTQCVFGGLDYPSTEGKRPLTYFVDWMFWNIWQQRASYVGNETVNGITCYVYEVQGNTPLNFMMLWVPVSAPVVAKWSISYHDTSSYSSEGFVVNVLPNTFSLSTVAPTSPQFCYPRTFRSPKFDEKRAEMERQQRAFAAEHDDEAPRENAADSRVHMMKTKVAEKRAKKDLSLLLENGLDLLRRIHREY